MIADELELPAGKQVGPYEIRKLVGAGGMGDVYAAEHRALGRQVAIKVLRRALMHDAVAVARFLREGKLAARIRHPHIVDVTDVAIVDELPCLVMELLEGESLDAKVAREGALEVQQAVDLLLPIVAALAHAHEEGVLHRDLKPSNVFLARGFRREITPKLLDFGISKQLDETVSANLTGDQEGFLGTPRYAAPELLQAEPASARSDQYAMALVFYEVVTGKKPFAELGGNLLSLGRAIASGDCKRLRELRPGIDEGFEQIIRRAMAVLPKDRFLTMSSFGAALLPHASEASRAAWAPVFAVAEESSTAITSTSIVARVRGAHADPSPSPSPTSREPATITFEEHVTLDRDEPETVVMRRSLEPVGARTGLEGTQRMAPLPARPVPVAPSTPAPGLAPVSASFAALSPGRARGYPLAPTSSSASVPSAPPRWLTFAIVAMAFAAIVVLIAAFFVLQD